MSTPDPSKDTSREVITSLFPDQDERERIFSFLRGAVDCYSAELPDIGVSPSMSKKDIGERLSHYDFDGELPAISVLSDVLGMLKQGIVHVTSPNYFGLFNPSTSFWGCVADFLTGVYNPQLAAWSHAPACVDIEDKLIRYLGERAGFDPARAGGAFTTGGAEANCTAMICAMTRKLPDFASIGLWAQDKQPVFYISGDSHLAWLKIALQCGLGRDAARLVDTDEEGRMDVDRLREILREDLANDLMPFMLVGTAGTTSAGSIDPLVELSRVAEEYGLYFHVDAAWAGAVLLSDRYAPLLNGIAEADSITLDAHKWLAAPMGTGMFICKDRVVLREPFAVTTNYMPPKDEANADPYVNSLQWSRRFSGLRVFIPLAILGREGFGKMIDYQVETGHYLAQALAQHGWEVVNATPLPVVCFRDVLDGDLDSILAQALESNKVWLSSTVFDGRKALRACVTSFRSTKDDVDGLIAVLNEARDAVSPTVAGGLA